jgi:hypothetical protein
MKVIKYFLMLLTIFAVTSACNKDDENPFDNNPQIWELTFTSGTIVQVVEVVVSPFTNSGTFGETDDSLGLWMFDAGGMMCYRLNVGGNIVHDSPGDRWSFVAMSGSGCGMQTLGGNSSGTANNNFPCADFIDDGVVTLTTQTPNGTVSAVATWMGQRIEPSSNNCQ